MKPEIVATDHEGFQYTRAELHDVFWKYQDRQNWKKPFVAYVISEYEARALPEAISFFCADTPEVEGVDGGWTKITSHGYQAW
jgi:hypothetical protein